MQIILDNAAVSFELIDSDLAPIYQRILSHLRHVDIPFRAWDNPYHVSDLIGNLVKFGSEVGVTVDQGLCTDKDQDYFNFLHKIYEKNYVNDPDPAWLNFHEHIHLCESTKSRHQHLHIDYRDRAGLLEKFFNIEWLKNSTTQVKAGDVFVKWAELGKIPYNYWLNKEPNDLDRIKELCKPWLKLRPKILVALQDHDFRISSDAFEQWWQQYHAAWCQHWNVPKWDLTDMKSVLVFGKMSRPELERLTALLMDHQHPRRVAV